MARKSSSQSKSLVASEGIEVSRMSWRFRSNSESRLSSNDPWDRHGKVAGKDQRAFAGLRDGVERREHARETRGFVPMAAEQRPVTRFS